LESLPGRLTQVEAKSGSVRALGEAVVPAFLLIGDADRQIIRRVELFVHDRLVANGRPHDRVAGVAQGVEEGAKASSVDDERRHILKL